MPFPRRYRSLLDEFFRDFPSGYSVRPLHGDPLPSPEDIRIEVKEKDDTIVVQAELPGVGKDDIDVSIDDNVLTVKAEIRQYDADAENEKVLHSERYYGSVQRSLMLPAAVDAAKASASHQDGILKLIIPKKNKGQTKKIAIG